MARSGSPYSTPRDANRVPLLIAASTADGVTPVVLEADPNTHQLQVSSSGGGGSGTEYTDGAVAPVHPVGGIPVFNNAGTITAVSAANPLPVSATISTAGIATSTKQSDGSQKTQIVDGSGNVIGATSNALDINIKSGNPTAIIANAGTNLNTSALALETGGNLAAIKTDVDKIPSQGQALAAASMPVVLPAAQITTLTPPSTVAVTNTGTFAVQATLAAETTKVIGTVNQGTSPWVGNTSQINGVTPLMGNGVTGTGSQRVTIASDNTAFSVNATLSTETTKVIGVVRTADGSGNLLTSTSNALDVNLKTSAASNISTNVAQMNGVAVSMGVGASGTGTQRVVQANDSGKTLVSTGGSAASSGNNTLVAAGTNRLKVFAFSLSTTSTTAMTCVFQSGASGTELWRCILQAPTSISTGANLVVQPPAWLFATASATLLNLNLSSANAVHWSVSYFDEA